MKNLLAIVLFCTLSTAVYSMTFPDRKQSPPGHHQFYTGLISYFKNLDPKVLQIEDEAKLEEYFLPLNYKIDRYVKERYDKSLTEYFEINDPAILVAGLLIGVYEVSNEPNPLELKIDPKEIVECAAAALGMVKGIKDIITSYTSIMNGTASLETVWGVVRNIGKRYVGWITLGIALYKFGDCMDWW